MEDYIIACRLIIELAEFTKHCETQIQQFRNSSRFIRLDHAYTAFLGEVIRKMCPGDEPIGFLDNPDFAPE